jgi:hypothetical protein
MSIKLFDETSIAMSRRLALNYSTSFSLGIRLLSKECRWAIFSIYGLVRVADEIVDTFHGYNKEQMLMDFKSQTYRAMEEGISTNPVLHAFQLAANQYGTGALYNSWSNWQYTPDPCVVNPLSSTTCSGYQAAYQTQMCAANPTYNSACPGYADAMFTIQCTASPLSNPACPSYASAYLTYQCTVNPL